MCIPTGKCCRPAPAFCAGAFGILLAVWFNKEVSLLDGLLYLAVVLIEKGFEI
jgi:hypothetical protein